MIVIQPEDLDITVHPSRLQIGDNTSLFLDRETGNLVAVTEEVADQYLADRSDPDRYEYIGEIRNEY